jgi:hypothetical protein
MFLSYVLRFSEEHKTYISQGTLRNIRDLCSSGFPEERNLDYVLWCHVAEEHTLYLSRHSNRLMFLGIRSSIMFLGFLRNIIYFSQL